MPQLTPKKAQFPADTMAAIHEYIKDQIDYLLMESDAFHNSVIPEWTRLLKGVPLEKERSLPFPKASNLVVQLIATRVEQLLARVMVLYSVDPLWTITALCDLVGQEVDEQAKILEQFMGDMAIEPEELNLYKAEEQFFHDGIAYGTSFIGLPWQYKVEQQHVSIAGQSSETANKLTDFKTLVKKDGPIPENIPLYRILVSRRIKSLDDCRFFAREIPLTREEVEDRIAFAVWSKEDGEEILKRPDSYGEQANRLSYDSEKQLQTTGMKYDAVYLVYECHIKWTHNRKTYSLIAHYSKATGKVLTLVFNYWPKNSLPYEDLRFGYDGDTFHGYGFIEMLQYYQDEMSQEHNNRLDNEAIRNNVSFRIDKNSEISSKLKFYPGVVIPADENEVEVLNTGQNALDNLASEQATISMVNERSGIDPAIAGAGGGIINPKRGIYSSQGTLAVLQQQNNRTGLRMMDVHGVHTRIGRKLLDLYAFIGIGKRLQRYGEQAEKLRKALDNVRSGNLGLLLKASSASTNVEQDRQNSILLVSIQEKYIATVNSILQLMDQAQNSDPNKVKWFQDILFAQQALTRHIFRLFRNYDVDKILPFPEFIKNGREQAQRAATATANGAGAGAGQIPQAVPINSSFGPDTVPTTATPQ